MPESERLLTRDSRFSDFTPLGGKHATKHDVTRSPHFSACSSWPAQPPFAQFTASIQGVVQDPSGAGIAKASIQLVNAATGGATVATSDASGNYRFVSLAPGSYKLTVDATGSPRPKWTSTGPTTIILTPIFRTEVSDSRRRRMSLDSGN